ncbi:MAG TPA: hypothetical protein DEP72_00460 [Clostridiales bacterium]|nr:MAG: hypothetical protein A2Y18_01045 [Clostridiales bacterium GWD2_32_19]HCC06623.1 hypothetical protein [Clostridiales bacterium]
MSKKRNPESLELSEREYLQLTNIFLNSRLFFFNTFKHIFTEHVLFTDFTDKKIDINKSFFADPYQILSLYYLSVDAFFKKISKSCELADEPIKDVRLYEKFHNSEIRYTLYGEFNSAIGHKYKDREKGVKINQKIFVLQIDDSGKVISMYTTKKIEENFNNRDNPCEINIDSKLTLEQMNVGAEIHDNNEKDTTEKLRYVDLVDIAQGELEQNYTHKEFRDNAFNSLARCISRKEAKLLELEDADKSKSEEDRRKKEIYDLKISQRLLLEGNSSILPDTITNVVNENIKNLSQLHNLDKVHGATMEPSESLDQI